MDPATSSSRRDSLVVGSADHELDAQQQRGCAQIVVTSFTFQAPEFYAKQGYVETGRTQDLPVTGAAEVHLRRQLPAAAAGPRAGS